MSSAEKAKQVLIDKVKQVFAEAEHDWYGEKRNPVILSAPKRGGGWVSLKLDDVRALLSLAEGATDCGTTDEGAKSAPLMETEAPAPVKRKYNMSPEGRAAHRERMKEYWRKRKEQPE